MSAATRPDQPEPAAADPGSTLSFRTPSGQPVTYPAAFGPDRPGDGRFLTRSVTVAEGWELVQHRLPVAAVTVTRIREALEREVGAAVAICRAVEDGPHAAAFDLVVGYQLDADEPFVLYQPPRGRALADFAQRMQVEEWERMLRALVVATRVLAAAGVAHRDITPHSVRWDGNGVRLGRPLIAEFIGRSRWSAGRPPFASPEQRVGTGVVDARDDVWSVAQVAYYMLTGRSGSVAGRPADLDTMQALARPLGGAFGALAAERPTPEEILRLLRCPDPVPPTAAGSDPLEAGRLAFDEVRRIKANGSAMPPRVAPGRPERPGGSGGPGGSSGDGTRRRWLPGRAPRGVTDCSGG